MSIDSERALEQAICVRLLLSLVKKDKVLEYEDVTEDVRRDKNAEYFAV